MPARGPFRFGLMSLVMLVLLAGVAIGWAPLGHATAVNPTELLDDPAMEARARAIGRQLRCPVCQNQSIDDSEAPIAADLRRLVRERLLAGDSDAEVIGVVRGRYGDGVLLRPPFATQTLLLWLGPLLMLAAGLALAVWWVRRQEELAAETGPAAPDPEEAAALRRVLDDAAGTTELSGRS